MSVALARKTLLHEWRRFLPAVLAVALSCLLLLVQTALVLGIFGSAAVAIERSAGDLWVGYPGTQSVELGRVLPPDTENWLRMDPDVAMVEPFLWNDGDWRTGAGLGAVSISVSGISTRRGARLFAHALNDGLRERLAQPDAVIVDRADLPKLRSAVGDRPRINGHEVQIVGSSDGLRALGGVNVLASLDTARRLADSSAGDERATYYLVSLNEPARAESVRERLAHDGIRHGYQVWTREAFARQAVSYWMFETGAGLGVLFLSGVVCLVGLTVTSQALMAAVAGSVPEYATLHALGVGMAALRRVVLSQAAWVGAVGLLLGAFGSAGALWLAHEHDVPVALTPPPVLGCLALVMAIALLSGLAATRVLQRADPATLLR
jgi:putative ABC transport system permease protein